jgi:hypothetical protein
MEKEGCVPKVHPLETNEQKGKSKMEKTKLCLGVMNVKNYFNK